MEFSENMTAALLTAILIVMAGVMPALASVSFDVPLSVDVYERARADAGGPYSGKPGIAIDFDGTHSYDPDGTIVSYAWDLGDGGMATGPTPSHTYSSAGTFTVELTVTDGEGLTDSDTTTATVSAPPPSPPPSGGGGIMPSNEPPVADAGPDRTVYVNVAIHFNGAGSYDPDGTIVEYHWFPGDGSHKSGVKVVHVYEEVGNYTVSLSVTDNNGATGTDSCTVTVQPLPVEPQTKASETVPANQTDYVVDALDTANTTVTLNTTDAVTVTVIKYESNPHPEDPLPEAGIAKYADIYVSDPDAVEWPIYVEMTYTDEEAEGLDEASLGIYYWMDGAWQRCSDTGVDTENNIVWAYMTADEASGSPILMGGMPAIILPPLPPILDNLNITPAALELGDNVTIGFDIENIDSQNFTYVVTMQIGGWLTFSPYYNVTQIYIELESYESKTVSHTLTMDMVGDFNVTVDGMTGRFTVEAPKPPPKPAEFVVSNLTVTPEFGFDIPFEIGEFVICTVSVKNIGEMEGTYTVEWKVDGETIDTQNVTLAAGSGRHARAYYEALNAGTSRVSVGDLTETVTVRAPLETAKFTVSDLVISMEEIEAGEGVAVFVEVMNIGEVEGSYALEIEIDGIVTEIVEVTLDGGESTTVTFMGGGSIGNHTVEIGRLSGSFMVKPEPSYWSSPESVRVILVIIVIIVATAILYAKWKGILPSFTQSLSSNLDDEKIENRRNKT